MSHDANRTSRPATAESIGKGQEHTGLEHPADGSTLLGHPTGLFLLFLVEMWERFSYYGMRGLLVLYLISVVAAHQLQPGTYTNSLEITEVAGQASAEPQPAGQARTLLIAVGQPAGSLPSEVDPQPSGTGRLVLRRVNRTVAEDGSTVWAADGGGGDGGVVVTGQPGDKASFGPGEFAYEITNPTDQPIVARVEIKADNATGQTYFTINDNPGSVTATIKPDAQRAAGEEPFRAVVSLNSHDSGRNWSRAAASTLYGWYTGLAYLFPILGGLIADKLIGTHRSMIVGGLLIAIGHVVLAVSGFGEMAQSALGMSVFIGGLALIVVGTGHFKPSVSVMVGQLYRPGDPRRDGAFTIFYMGINLGAFLCAFVCGTLGEKVGWHWGFGSAAVGMLLGLGLYAIARPRYLRGIGLPPAGRGGSAPLFIIAALGLSAIFAAVYHYGLLADLGDLMTPTVVGVLAAIVLGLTGWFIAVQRPEDRGPVASIFIFMAFNAFFWLAFEQAGSSINIFTEQNTDRRIGGFEVPATWFQSVNAGLIFMMAPLFAGMWTALGKRRLNPSQPVKIGLGLLFLGFGYVFMVWAGQIAANSTAKASMLFIIATYFWHTVGELFLSPTGLSYVTKAAPARFVSLLMGIWFISSFIANLGGGLVAAKVEAIERGEIDVPWNFGGQADFFFLFVVTSAAAGLLILLLTPLLKKLIQGRED